jgi:hypothetical protein
MSTEFNIPPGTTNPAAIDTTPRPLSEVGQPKKAEEDTRIQYHDEEQLNKFWNCVVNKTPYTKKFEIRGLTIILRTKTSKEIEALMLRMDKHNTSLVSTYDYLYAKSVLAISAVQIGNDMIDSGTFEQKLEYINGLSEVTLRVLIKALGIFEKEIETMEGEIYSPNF